MISSAIKQIKIAFLLLIIFSIITGLIYPGIITGIAQLLFNWRANGSFVQSHGKTMGSELMGQYFDDPKYFWGRPSATTPFPYNTASSTGSNLGPSNPAFLTGVKQQIDTLHQADLQYHASIPVDLVTASGSGLDPEISPLAAYYQVHRIAQARRVSEAVIKNLVKKYIVNRAFGILGEPRVNVLKINLALDQQFPSNSKTAFKNAPSHMDKSS